ncbi:MAG: hypothetical protein HFI33_12360 [Lachnospiraceae bacterium]|nr:hypothetical protein [Lachnospiraceae bacterium]
MKRFLRAMLPFVLFVLILEIGIPMYADPYNVFHWSKIRDNGVEPNSNYIKMKYILANPDKFDSFLFGSSRTGFVDVERIPEGKWYNMSYSEGLPNEHLENLKEMIAHGIIPKNVMIGVDNISCFVNPALHEKQFYRIPYPRTNLLSFYANYFSIRGVIKAQEVTGHHQVTDPDYVERYYRSGCSNRNLVVENDWNSDAPYWEEYYENQLFNSIHDMVRIRELCEEYDINLIVFTNPIYYTTYQHSELYGYKEWLSWLANDMEFYNFSGVNAITTDKNNYIETSHYNMQVGDMIIDRIFHNKTDAALESQGFGFYVTLDNRENYLKALANH